MSPKATLILCASVLILKTISGQCIGSLLNNGLGNGLYGLAGNGLYGNGLNGCGCGATGLGYSVPASSGGGLAISSASPIAPNGVAVASDNAIEGILAVSGSLPFLGAVGLEGQMPSAGSAGVSYSCGNGNIGIVGEGIGAGLGYGIGPVYGAGLANAGVANLGLANSGLVGGRYGLGGCGCY